MYFQGVITISTRAFELPNLALQSTYILTESEIESIRAKLPSSPGIGIAECQKRCHLLLNKNKSPSLTHGLFLFIIFLLALLL